MVEEIIPDRKPLFSTETEKVNLESFPKSEEKVVLSEKNNKLVISLAVVFVAIVVIVVVLISGGSYVQEVSQKSSLLIPMFLGRKKNGNFRFF